VFSRANILLLTYVYPKIDRHQSCLCGNGNVLLKYKPRDDYDDDDDDNDDNNLVHFLLFLNENQFNYLFT